MNAIKHKTRRFYSLMTKALRSYSLITKVLMSFINHGSVVECSNRDRRAAGSSLTGVTVLWSLSKVSKGAKIRNRYNQVPHVCPSLALVRSRKTRPYITERLLMVRKESNQTNKQNILGPMQKSRKLLDPIHLS